MSDFTPIPEALIERVLERLGFSAKPSASIDGLALLYTAWCERVPFDNVRKLIQLAEAPDGQLPGTYADDFFEAWLTHGTGGTCWSGSNALFTLLRLLGFAAERCIATMLVVPHLPPNHGTVRVEIDGSSYLVDTSILFGKPLLLDESGRSEVAHPASGVSAARSSDGLWTIRWRPVHQPAGLDCRVDRIGADHVEYRRRYDDTRDWSPFNYQLTARRNRGDEVIGASFGKSVTLLADGSVAEREIDDAERRRILVEDIGLSEEIVSRLPADRPTPPPPGSKTAAAVSNHD